MQPCQNSENKTRQRKLGLLELHFPKSWIDIEFSELKNLFFSVHLDLIKYGKLSRGPRTGKCQFSFQSQRREMPNNVQTTSQLHSFHTVAK